VVRGERHHPLAPAHDVVEHPNDLVELPVLLLVLFCPLTIRSTGRAVAALALAPLAVRPLYQRRGIGSRLVREGLTAAAAGGHRIVTVLGHSESYPRFGFTAEAARPLAVPFAGPAWMAMELVPGSLAGVSGPVVYPKAFGIES
jgi:putative acetyltransferase